MNPGTVSHAQYPPPTFSLPEAAAATTRQLAMIMMQSIMASTRLTFIGVFLLPSKIL
jgi:hypothetical protein